MMNKADLRDLLNEEYQAGYYQGLEDGYNEGYDQGYKDGYEDGFSDGKDYVPHQRLQNE